MQNIPARKNAGRSLSYDVDRYPDGRRNYVSKIGGTIEEEGGRRLSSTLNLSVVTNGQHNGSAKFPKLEDCTHFHYDTVDIGTLQVCLYEGSVILDDRPQSQHSTSQTSVHLQVKTSRGDHSSSSWIIDRSMDSLCKLDRQLHQCVFDRKYSLLPVLGDNLFTSSSSATNDVLHKDDVRHIISLYFKRLSTIAGNMINCAAILNWFETDNRGNRIIVASDSSSAINIPAVGAALVIKRYMAQVPDEISLEVGEIISLIDMPPLTECNWWRGKRQFEVGFFPADCVESISGRVPAAVVARASQTLVKPVLRKRGKLIVRLRAFFTSRPARNQLKRSGIVKERVFGCDLGELLLNSGHNVPSVLKFCTEVIESHGIVDGIYRLSGIASNIQKLRREFDDDRVPTLTEDIYIRDIHSISSLLKMYFRELPNPLLTYQLYDKFVEAIQDDENKLVKIHNVIQQLPPPHYRTCAYLMKHLSLMASFGKKTCMTGRNLAIVWAPNLLRCKELELMQCNITALKSVGTQAVITEFLINYADLLFNENLTSSVISRRNNSCRRQMRPKSLAISTPTKLLSLEEARQRALLTCNQADQQVFLDVGGGPAALPPVYHTVIDVSKRRHSGRRKKNPSTSMSLLKDLLGHKSNTSNRDSATNGAATDGTSAIGPQSSLSCLDKSAGEVSASKEMKQSAGEVEAPPKKGSRHLRARASTSIHSSTPYSTPPIDSCSLEDLTTCGHQPVSFTSSGLTTALSKSFQRSQSVGYDPSEATTSRKSVTFSESTYSTLSETGASRAMRVSTALPEESLSSGASSDDVFMSASGSRECSTSPIEAPLKSIGSNVVRLPSKVKRDKKGMPAINSAEEEQNAELNSDIYYSINGSDSGSEQPAGSRRPTYSEPVHCVSDLCSDEDENYTCDSGKSDRFSFTKRFHSPVGYYSSTSKRSFRSGDVGLESSSALQMNLSDCLNVSRESDNSLFSRALGNDSTRCCDTDCDNVLEYRRCDKKRSSSTMAENRDDVGDICEPQTSTLVHSDSRLPTRYVDGEKHKGKSCVISGVHESMTSIPRLANGLPDETTETDRPAVPSAVLNNDYPHQRTDESVDVVKGFEEGCDVWRFIDDTDDDVFSDQPAGDTNQQDSETAAKLLLTSSCIDNSPMDADLTSGSPFLSPPDSPSMLEAVTGVWLKEFGDKKGNSTKVDCNPKVRRVISEPVNCQQQMNLVANITPRHTTEYDSEGHTSPRHTTQCDTEGHWFNHRSRSSGSFFRHGPALDQVKLQCDAELPRLVVFGDGACVSECNISNNANQSLDLGCHLTCNEGFVSADDKANDKGCRDQYQTAEAIFEIADNFSNSSFGNGITSIPDVIRDATNSRATTGVSLRKKSVKELKSKFEQNIVNERLELTRASQIRKMPLPRYSRSQSYHGFQSADSAPVSSLNCNDTYGLSKFGRSIGVLTVDVVPCENIKRMAAVSNKAHFVRDDNKSHFTALDESRFIFKSVDDELQFMARYAVPSVSARISCFEPLLSASRLSPEFRTAPENKRARLSSCGSTVASNANRQNATVSEACRVASKSMIADGDDHCRPSVSGCDLLSLLDIPAMAALSLPKVSERKRLFEAESAKLLNGHSAEVRRSSSSEDSDHKQKSPSSKENKENSSEVTDLKGRSTSRRKLFESSVLGDDDTAGRSKNFNSMTRDSLEKVCDRVESNFAGVTAASQQHSLWTDPYILPT